MKSVVTVNKMETHCPRCGKVMIHKRLCSEHQGVVNNQGYYCKPCRQLYVTLMVLWEYEKITHFKDFGKSFYPKDIYTKKQEIP